MRDWICSPRELNPKSELVWPNRMLPIHQVSDQTSVDTVDPQLHMTCFGVLELDLCLRREWIRLVLKRVRSPQKHHETARTRGESTT
jgi:hypothetical protein